MTYAAAPTYQFPAAESMLATGPVQFTAEPAAGADAGVPVVESAPPPTDAPKTEKSDKDKKKARGKKDKQKKSCC
jgi:hypothetical protein